MKWHLIQLLMIKTSEFFALSTNADDKTWIKCNKINENVSKIFRRREENAISRKLPI